MLFMKKIKKPENRNTLKNKIVLLITTFAFVFVGYSLYSNNKNNYDRLPDSPEININTYIHELAVSNEPGIDDYRLYGSLDNEYVKLYFASDYNPADNENLYIDYITKITWHIKLEPDSLNTCTEENNLLSSLLNSHYSNSPQDYGGENYWIAASFDFNSEVPSATYDINLKSPDLNLNDKGFQEAIRYFNLECLYNQKINAFDVKNWDTKLNYHDTSFSSLLYSFDTYYTDGSVD